MAAGRQRSQRQLKMKGSTEPGATLSPEVLDTLCKATRRYLSNFSTSLKLSKYLEISKLSFLKHRVIGWFGKGVTRIFWRARMLINAILDLMGSEDCSSLRRLWLSRELVLKSHWTGRSCHNGNPEGRWSLTNQSWITWIRIALWLIHKSEFEYTDNMFVLFLFCFSSQTIWCPTAWDMMIMIIYG